MKNHFLKLYIYLTLIISLFLQIIFTNNSNIILHISFLLLTLIYWLLEYPYIINITTGFFLGLTIDLFTNNILGIYSLVLSILIYFLSSNYKLIINFNIIYKMLFIICILYIIHMIIYFLNSVEFNYWNLFLQSIFNSLIWIIIYFCFKKISFMYKNFPNKRKNIL
ncbi:rod shape-determining protein MreD [Enterobacteriaceae endosymbiont of Donacia versicolorea]|uniref:rod shape-determining protein MreD n=1 Tax=Enterobacteriaceae endosymbiont of Donacia versicolorea TaxID=2675788 RepID=UPI001449EC7B|nr:rod shape-determining protein MreD [Enterobacteriaceae endosymbiont of Donacia versicolorea]QJC31896.1 rod shape-determining protein MreD [Enterobacteriaceae endosymbiont of Donacia versicolorea]